ncbi:MAG: SDR family NAD(P)-dependent oxidoreductase [Pseudomonadota bacterium]
MPENPKTVWITGASSGLGEALAHEFANDDHQVCLSARSADKLAAVNSSLSKSGKVYACDVTDDYALTTTVEKIFTDVGAIDIAVLNAGVYVPTPLADLNADDARGLFEVNFFSIIRTIELLVPRMTERDAGHIVVVSSVAGDVGLPYASVYSASKSALHRLCESLYPELQSKGVLISVVSPGFVRTPATDKNDFPMPFIISAERAAQEIREGIAARRFEIRFPFMMGFIMRRLAHLPKPLLLWFTKRMLRNDDAT